MKTHGPGKYDELCTLVRQTTGGKLALIAIVQGKLGSGFSIQCELPSLLPTLPGVLRTIADKLEQDLKHQSPSEWTEYQPKSPEL